jgi:hypothetical protein
MAARDIGDDGIGREALDGDPRFLRVGKATARRVIRKDSRGIPSSGPVSASKEPRRSRRWRAG